MQGKLFGPPPQKAAAVDARTETGRVRRWLRKNALPLVGGLALSAFAGTMAVVGTDQVSLDAKIKAWHSELGFSKGCDTGTYLKVLGEVREEVSRRMEARDSRSLEKLFDVERAAMELYNSDMRDPACAKDAGR